MSDDTNLNKEIIERNRDRYLRELRSNKYKKGTIKSDYRGLPIIETPEDNDGMCACALMIHLFDPHATTSTLKSRSALGISSKDCMYIQHELNDTTLNFSQIADIIEKEIFNR